MKTAKMTRAHFEHIAATLRGLRYEPAVELETLEMVIREFARTLPATNAGFKRERFLEAAGYGETKVEAIARELAA